MLALTGSFAVMAEDETEGENGGTVTVTAPSVLLMEASSGKVLFEKDADTKRPPASVTKVMTILLIYDALSEGKIHKEDVVTVSEYAASMGGSQVFLGGWGRADGRYTSKNASSCPAPMTLAWPWQS